MVRLVLFEMTLLAHPHTPLAALAQAAERRSGCEILFFIQKMRGGMGQRMLDLQLSPNAYGLHDGDTIYVLAPPPATHAEVARLFSRTRPTDDDYSSDDSDQEDPGILEAKSGSEPTADSVQTTEGLAVEGTGPRGTRAFPGTFSLRNWLSSLPALVLTERGGCDRHRRHTARRDGCRAHSATSAMIVLIAAFAFAHAKIIATAHRRRLTAVIVLVVVEHCVGVTVVTTGLVVARLPCVHVPVLHASLPSCRRNSP